MPDHPTPRPPRPTEDQPAASGAAGGDDEQAAAGSHVVEDVRRSLSDLDDLAPEEQVAAYQDLEKALRDTLRTAGEDD